MGVWLVRIALGVDPDTGKPCRALYFLMDSIARR
jgi:hypothetical protein